MTNAEAIATIRGIFARGICPMTDVTSEILDIALQKGGVSSSLYCNSNTVMYSAFLPFTKL